MTIIEKNPSMVVQSPSPSRSRVPRRDLRSPDKSARKDGDLLSSATSALRRLHFKSASSSRTKKGQPGQAVPKLMVMGSSTTSETTINTSTDSSNTVYTTVTVTDADQEQEHTEIMENKELLRHDIMEPKSPVSGSQRSREVLSEFDELFLEHEKRIQREMEQSRKVSPRSPHQRKVSRKDSSRSTVSVVTIESSEDRRCTTVKDGRLMAEAERDRRRSSQLSERKRDQRSSESEEDKRRSSQFLDNRRREKMSSESEDDRRGPTCDGNFLRAAGSSSERDSDDIFSSTEDHPRPGFGAPPPTPTPLLGSTVKSGEFFSKSIIDDDAMKNLGSLVENGNFIYEKKRPRPKSERPKSSVRTIQNDIPQRTFSTNFTKRNKNRSEDIVEGRRSPRITPREEKTMFPFPPRLPSRPSSPSLSPGGRTSPRRRSSNSPRLEHAGTLPLGLDSADSSPPAGVVAALTLSNVEKHEKQTSLDVKKKRKFENIFSMDSPSTMQTSSPTPKSGIQFEFPSVISPTEIKTAFDKTLDKTDNDEHISQIKILKNDDRDLIDNHHEDGTRSRRRQRNDRKSISVETPIKLLEADEKISQNRRTSDVYRDLILEDKITAMQNRKYSVLASDGSVKNFVSENSKEMKKTGLDGGGGGKKPVRRGSEVPQRHRRVSIVQGDSLRHFIFEEPDVSRQKTPTKNRKVSVVVENLDDFYNRKSSLVPGDTLRNLLGEEPRGDRKSSIVPGEAARKFSINTLGDIVSARKFSLLPPGEIYTSQIDGKTTEIIKLKPGPKGRPLATIVVQQASFQRGSISGPSGGGDDLLDVANTFTLEELHEFDMKYGSPHHCRSQSVKTPGRSCGRPNYLCLPQQRSRVASMPNTGVEEEYYRLRHFSITGKHVVNRGDSLKSRRSRSNNSVASSNSSHSTEHMATNMGTVGSHPESARTSAECSLASSRESSTTTVPYKVVMLGAAGVGKTSLVSQFMTSEYLHAYDTSLDEEYGEKSVSVLLDAEESELIFVDHSSGEMSPENCISTYSPQAFVVIYSVVDKSSILQAEEILQTLWKSETINSKAVILVGNKADLVRSRVVPTEEGKNIARAYDCKYIETSVGINHNVDELLVGILTQIRLKIQQSLKPKRTKSPMRSCMGKDEKSPKKSRNTRLSASLRVKKLLDKVWSRDSKSKSCENLHVL